MNDEAVVESDGVQIRKSFDADDFPVPAVTFEVTSERDDDVTVRIVDEIPEEFGIDQIGFHPDYGSDFWSATGDGEVRFERTVEAGEAFTTVYGVRLEDAETPDPFLTPPVVEVGDSLDDIVPPESSEVVRDLVSGDRDTVPGLEDTEEPTYEDDDIIEAPSSPADAVGSGIDELEATMTDDAGEAGGESPAEANADDAAGSTAETGAGHETDPGSGPETDPGSGPEADAAAEATTGAADAARDAGSPAAADDGSPAAADDGSPAAMDAAGDEPAAAGDVEDDPNEVVAGDAVGNGSGRDATAAEASTDADDPVAALADAIRNGDADDEDLAVVREELGVTGGTSRSDEVTVEHLQARVSDLEAYADALEAFIDENGTAAELLEGLESDVEQTRGAVDDVEERVETVETQNEALRSDLSALEGDVADLAALGEDLHRLEGDLEALDERVADVEEVGLDLEELATDVESIREDIQDLQEWRDQLSNVLG